MCAMAILVQEIMCLVSVSGALHGEGWSGLGLLCKTNNTGGKKHWSHLGTRELPGFNGHRFLYHCTLQRHRAVHLGPARSWAHAMRGQGLLVLQSPSASPKQGPHAGHWHWGRPWGSRAAHPSPPIPSHPTRPVLGSVCRDHAAGGSHWCWWCW